MQQNYPGSLFRVGVNLSLKSKASKKKKNGVIIPLIKSLTKKAGSGHIKMSGSLMEMLTL